jgi:signal transduction histidine kinase
MTSRADRLATSFGVTILATGVLFALDRAGTLTLGWDWCLALMTVIGGAALLAVARTDTPALYAGVLAGLAERHLLSVWQLRAAVLLTAPLAGCGVALYAAAALWQSLGRGGRVAARVDWRRTTGIGLVGLGAVLAFIAAGGPVGPDAVVWPVLLIASGLSLFWLLPDARRVDVRPGEWQDFELRYRLALTLIFGGAVYLLDATGLFSQAARTIAGAAAALAVLALVIGPRWRRTSRALAHERVERARAAERADIGGRVHDSVLQTLALIQERADDPAEVRALVRRQERDLRAQLLDGPGAAVEPASVVAALRAVAADVEDTHRVTIEVVTVGDGPLGPDLDALMGAAREALVNAARHATGAPISLFVEVDDKRVSAYVRDRGPGFDSDAVPADRRGVRDSIVARMVRSGGHAVVRTAPGGGCEVRLVQERRR